MAYILAPGFAAIVNKQLSAKYDVLVNDAPQLIKVCIASFDFHWNLLNINPLFKVLPWGKDFEVDVFRKPDFTALEILSFATGGKHRCIVCLLIIQLYCI
jgi:dipeptidyl-peptidase-3